MKLYTKNIAIFSLFLFYVGCSTAGTKDESVVREKNPGFNHIWKKLFKIFHSIWVNGFFMYWFGQQYREGFEYHLLVITIGLILILGSVDKILVDDVITDRMPKT